ncbi:MAG: hypothetical protein WCO94_03525 [Verrucomicrobiota bacterium]
MIPLPPEPSSGYPIIDWARLVMSFLRRIRPIGGPGIRINEGTNGFTISVEKGDSPDVQDSPKPFQLFVATDPADTSVPPTPKIRVIPSTLAGESSTDLGFSTGDDPKYFLDPSEGVLVGGITWDTGTGEITSRWLEILSTFPDPSGVADGTDYVEIGTVHWVADDSEAGGHWTVSNSRYGPINATICRNWFAAEAPFFGCSWS